MIYLCVKQLPCLKNSRTSSFFFISHICSINALRKVVHAFFGDQINIVGRWHSVGGGSGVCICVTKNIEALTSWMVNWAEMCDIHVEPVVDDDTLRDILRKKLSNSIACS